MLLTVVCWTLELSAKLDLTLVGTFSVASKGSLILATKNIYVKMLPVCAELSYGAYCSCANPESVTGGDYIRRREHGSRDAKRVYSGRTISSVLVLPGGTRVGVAVYLARHFSRLHEQIQLHERWKLGLVHKLRHAQEGGMVSRGGGRRSEKNQKCGPVRKVRKCSVMRSENTLKVGGNCVTQTNSTYVEHSEMRRWEGILVGKPRLIYKLRYA